MSSWRGPGRLGGRHGHGRRRALSLCVGLRWHGLTTCIFTAAKTSLQVARNLVELRGGIPWVS